MLSLVQKSLALAALIVVLTPGMFLNVKLSRAQLTGGAPCLESVVTHAVLVGVVYQLLRPQLRGMVPSLVL